MRSKARRSFRVRDEWALNTPRQIFDECADIICVIDAQGHIVDASRSLETLLGYTREELLGRRVHELLLPEELRKIPVPVDNPNVEDVTRYERHFVRKGGSTVLVELTAQKLSGGRFMAIGRDMAARKQIAHLEERQAKQDRELQNQAHVLENIGEGVNYVDDQGIIRYTNAAFDEMFGYERGELLGQSATILNDLERAANEALVADLLSTLAAGGTWVSEFKSRKKNGTSFTTKAKIKKLPLQGEAHWVTVQEDVTEQKRTEQALRQMHKMESVGSLAAGIAHDFNNILTVVAGHADILDMQLQEDSPLREDVELIKVACQRATGLTRQLLMFNRKRMTKPTVVDLSLIVRDMSKMLTRLIGEDIRLTITLSDEVCSILADSTEFEQVLMNLAINARDAMPTGGSLLIETSQVMLDAAHVAMYPAASLGGHILLRVADTGTGMNADTRERIFDPFFTTKPRGQGTGLGLATVYGIVAQTGGHIIVESEVGRGSTFRIYIPRCQSSVVDVPNERTRKAFEQLGTETVLVVEDDTLVRRLIVSTLRDAGYYVLDAESPYQAIQVARDRKAAIPLLLTDVVMPEMSGRQLAERLSMRHAQMRVLYMSGYTDDAVLRHGIMTDEIAFLRKPFTRAQLVQKVRETLDSERTAVSDKQSFA